MAVKGSVDLKVIDFEDGAKDVGVAYPKTRERPRKKYPLFHKRYAKIVQIALYPAELELMKKKGIGPDHYRQLIKARKVTFEYE